MYSLSVEMENVQAIKHAIINFGTNGITEFVGDNSNGKSALSRVIEYLTSGDLIDKETRESLINDYAEEARVMFSKDREILGMILKRDRNDSVVIYNPDVTIEDNPEMVVRSIGDKGYMHLVEKFGFRTYSDGDICLQVCPTFGAVPFVSTKGRANMEITNAITADRVAEEFLDNYENIVSKAFRARAKTLEQQENSLKTLINACVLYDYEKYKELSNKMSKLIIAIGQYHYMELEEIPIPPVVEFQMVPEYQIEEIPIPVIGPIKSQILDLSQLIIDYENALNFICPTCLRRFTEHDEYAACQSKNTGAGENCV